VTNRKFIIPALVLAAVLGGAGAATMPASSALAQAASPPSADQQRPQRPPRPPRASHIEGRIAFLKTELKITPTQEAQFDKVASVLRQNSEDRRRSFEQMRPDRDKPRSALQHLETQARLSAMRAQQSDRFLAAFRPLYDTLSDQQKKVADDLMAPHFRGHGGHHRI